MEKSCKNCNNKKCAKKGLFETACCQLWEGTEETKKGPAICEKCGIGVLGELEDGTCPMCKAFSPSVAQEILNVATKCSPEEFVSLMNNQDEEPPAIPKEITKNKDDAMPEDRSCYDCIHYNTCLMRIRLTKALNGELCITKQSTRVKVYRAIGTDCDYFNWDDKLLFDLDL